MNNNQDLKLLFLINPGAGKKKIDWQEEISKYFASKPYQVEIFIFPENCGSKEIKEKISQTKPSKVVAVGGDGTIKTVADAICQTELPMCILPGGSANGMAKELGIPLDPAGALEVIDNGAVIK